MVRTRVSSNKLKVIPFPDFTLQWIFVDVDRILKSMMTDMYSICQMLKDGNLEDGNLGNA